MTNFSYFCSINLSHLLSHYFPITDPTWIFFIVLSIILFAPMVFERLRVPAIVGMICAGILIGPHGLHVLERDSSFELFGKVGLYYIMFLASLEMNLQDVQVIKWRALTLGLLSFALPMLMGYGANRFLLGYGAAAAVLMAAMYASHTLVTYPIVMRYGLARRQSVSIAVGATIVADTLTLLVLAVVGGMFKENVSGLYWVWLVLKVVLLSAVIIVTFPRMARWFFRRYDESVAQYIFVLALVFLGAALMEIVGMEGILGAFLVGIVLNRSIPPSSPLMSHVEFVGNALFIPYFLIGVGMLLDVSAFARHSQVFILAAVMIAVGLSSKWLSAYATQRLFGMPRREGTLMFGLTSSRAAATLAVVLVGHGIILPDGSRLLGEDVLNATMMFILVTCVVSSFATSTTARRIAESPTPERNTKRKGSDRIIVALSNPETVPSLIAVGLMLRSPGSPTPLTALNVVLEDDPTAREEGLRQLERAVKIAAAAGVRLVTRSRWSVNVVSGLSHTMKEFEASDLLVGLHQKAKITETFYGKLTTDLIQAVEGQIFIYRPVVPPATVTHMHLIIPRKAEFEPGFNNWAIRLGLLAGQIQCKVTAYSGRGTMISLQGVWDDNKLSVKAEQTVYNDWHDFISIACNARPDHLVVFVAARRGTLSFHNYMNQLPEQIEQYFSAHNLLIVFPSQPASSGPVAAIRAGVPVKVRA